MNGPSITNETSLSMLPTKEKVSKMNLSRNEINNTTNKSSIMKEFITKMSTNLNNEGMILEPTGNTQSRQEEKELEEGVELDSFKVFIRWRPLDQKELNMTNIKKRSHILKKQDNTIILVDPDCISNNSQEYSLKKEKSYIFDDIFDENDKTITVYNKAIYPVLNNIINGFNSTIFAYGMTGAGKTYTMFGAINNNVYGDIDAEPGIITLTMKDMLNALVSEEREGCEFIVKLSYLEIYNEHARDLLTNTGENLMIIEDPQKGVMIPNLTEILINTSNEIIDYIQQGNTRRVMASTHANQFSSRSHAIIQVIIEKKLKKKDNNVIIDKQTQSKLSLVDLAGSERASVTENKGLRQQEGANINRSLLALGNCINILSDINKKGAFVPYRDSKLTRLLKDSLGGNTKTIMIACVSPSYLAYEETINTLKYANRAKNIKKKVSQNLREVELPVSQYKGIIEDLRKEIDFLKSRLKEQNQDNGNFENPSKLLSMQNMGLDMIMYKSHSIPIFINEKNGSNTPAIIDNKHQVNSGNVGDDGSSSEKNLNDLGIRLFANLEENWEITQSINELKQLKVRNETELQEKISRLEKTSGLEENIKISQEINQLKNVMLNNDKIFKEMQQNLQKNMEEKKKIQEKIKTMNTSTYEANQLAEAYKNLNIEKCELYTQTKEIIQAARDLFKVKEQKDSEIIQLQKEMELMRQKLVEKDRLLAENQELIKNLTNQKPAEPSRRYTAIIPLNKDKRQNSKAHKERLTEPDIDRSNGLSNCARTISPIIYKRSKSPKFGLVTNKTLEKSPRVANQKSRNDRASSKSRNLQNPSPIGNMMGNSQKLKNKCSIGETKIPKTTNKIKPKLNILDSANIQELKSYAEKLKSINFDNVRIFKPKPKNQQNKTKQHDQNLKTLKKNFELSKGSIPIKHSFSLKNSNLPRQAFLDSNQFLAILKNSDASPIANNNLTEECKKNSALSPVKSFHGNQNFCEISSIIKEGNNIDASIDVSIKDMKDILTENFPPKFEISSINQSMNFSNVISVKNNPNSAKKNTSKIREQITPNNNIARNFIMKNANSCKSSTQTLIKKASRDMKSQKNIVPLSNIHEQQSDKKKRNTVIKVFDGNGNQLLSQNTGSFIEEKNNKAIEGKMNNNITEDKSNGIFSSQNTHQITTQSSKYLRRKTTTDIKYLPIQTNISNNLNHQLNIQQPINLENKIQGISTTTDIKCLDMERELTRAFKIKIHSLSSVIDNNLLDDYYIEQILECINEYDQKKYFLNNNDYLVFQKLQSVLLTKKQQKLQDDVIANNKKQPDDMMYNKQPDGLINNNPNNSNLPNEYTIQPQIDNDKTISNNNITPLKSKHYLAAKSLNGNIDSFDDKYDIINNKFLTPKCNNKIKVISSDESKPGKFINSKKLTQGMMSNINSDYRKALNKSSTLSATATTITNILTGDKAKSLAKLIINHTKSRNLENSPNVETERLKINASEPSSCRRQILTPERLLFSDNKSNINDIHEFTIGKKNRQSPAVQNLIEKQKKYLEEEFSKLQKFNDNNQLSDRPNTCIKV